jgi:polar amino acid transport system ATP-binding protein
VIEITGLHKSFGALEVLRGVDLTARAGDVVSLIGSSGSGKSTLLRCANLLEDSQQGEILFEGEPSPGAATGPWRRPADREQVRRIRTNLSMVFQQFNLWAHMTILQNVMEAPVTVLGRDKAEVETAARAISTRSASATNATPTPRSCRAASSSAPPSPARSAWSRARFSSTNRPPRSTPSSSRRSCA